MKKKILVLAMMFCVALSACSSKEDTENSESGKNNVESVESQLTITDGQVSIELDGDFALYKSKLGATKEYSESKSCLYDGYDKTYTYENLVIITYPIDGKEKVASITVLSEDVKHKLPISIGDSLDQIKSEYGEENLNMTDGCCIYEDDFGIAFYMADGVVVEIEIYTL